MVYFKAHVFRPVGDLNFNNNQASQRKHKLHHWKVNEVCPHDLQLLSDQMATF